jgi:hypothetical protein
MDNTLFIENIINKINNIRDEEFKINNFTYNEINIEKKDMKENIMDLKNFKNNLIKRAIKDKNKPSYVGKNEYDIDYNNINILEDDIFQNDEEKQEEAKLNIDNLDIEDKGKLIKDFIKRKCIVLEEEQLKKIDELLNDPEFNFKKNITISKMYQHVTKVLFLKKLENGSYIIDLSEKKVKNKNIFFK